MTDTFTSLFSRGSRESDAPAELFFLECEQGEFGGMKVPQDARKLRRSVAPVVTAIH